MSNIIVGNPPTLFYPFFPLFKKHMFLRLGDGPWEFKNSWTLLRIACENPHVDELDFGRPVFLQKVVKRNIPFENYPILHFDSH